MAAPYESASGKIEDRGDDFCPPAAVTRELRVLNSLRTKKTEPALLRLQRHWLAGIRGVLGLWGRESLESTDSTGRGKEAYAWPNSVELGFVRTAMKETDSVN